MDVSRILNAVLAAQHQQDAAAAALTVAIGDAPAALIDDMLGADDAFAKAECDRLVYELGRHLPGVAPAIHALAEHILAQERSQTGRCCRDRYSDPV